MTPHGGAAQVIFEYGPTTAYGSTVTAQTLGGGGSPVPVGAVAAGLEPSTRYHFRVVALRDGQRYEGRDASLVTAAGPPQRPPPPPPPPVAKVSRLVDGRLKADRKGFFKVRVAFGDTAPLGRARLTVLTRKGKRLARATTPVRRGRTVTKTLRLTAKARRTIRPGRSKRVKLELRLPGGAKLSKAVRLSRARR